MHSISICFGPQGTIWNLLFKTEEKPSALYNSYTGTLMEAAASGGEPGGAIIAADDFGQSLVIAFSQVHSMLLEDLDQSQLGQIERGLHNARSQAKAQQRAMGDPTIRASAMAQGPAVHSPFPNGRFS